ncbi:MAG: hypothetical protein IJD64_02585 [Clostridia bacterium]|nr:hypothetical protein [Clostridia bacterium]
MKSGYMFFLNLGNITKAARIAIIPGIFFLFFARGWFLMLLSLLFLALCIAFSVIHAPSDDNVMRVINEFYRSFEERLRVKSRSKEELTYLKGYREKGKMKLKRRVKGKVIFPLPMTFSVFTNDKGSFLMLGTLSLLKNAPPVFEEFSLDGSVSVEHWTVHEEEDSLTEIHIALKNRDEKIKMLVENTHTTREYLAYVQKVMEKAK